MPVDLNPHQDYLIREFAEEYLEAHMSRRDMMRRVLLITGSIPATAALAFTLGCGTTRDDAARATATAAGTSMRWRSSGAAAMRDFSSSNIARSWSACWSTTRRPSASSTTR